MPARLGRVYDGCPDWQPTLRSPFCMRSKPCPSVPTHIRPAASARSAVTCDP